MRSLTNSPNCKMEIVFENAVRPMPITLQHAEELMIKEYKESCGEQGADEFLDELQLMVLDGQDMTFDQWVYMLGTHTDFNFLDFEDAAIASALILIRVCY